MFKKVPFVVGIVAVVSSCSNSKTASKETFEAAIEANPGVDHCVVVRTEDPQAKRMFYRNGNILDLPYLIETLESGGVLARTNVSDAPGAAEFLPVPEFAGLFSTQRTQTRFSQGHDSLYFCPGRVDVVEITNFVDPGEGNQTTVEYRWKTVDMPDKVKALADAGRLTTNRPANDPKPQQQIPGRLYVDEPDFKVKELLLEGTSTRRMVLMDDGWQVQ